MNGAPRLIPQRRVVVEIALQFVRHLALQVELRFVLQVLAVRLQLLELLILLVDQRFLIRQGMVTSRQQIVLGRIGPQQRSILASLLLVLLRTLVSLPVALFFAPLLLRCHGRRDSAARPSARV